MLIKKYASLRVN